MSRAPLEVVLLGTGTSTGVPMIGCGCPVCRSDSPRNRRTRCSVLVAWEGRNLLIDTATDLRIQALREGIDHVDAVLFTHTHADHVNGIDDLRSFNPPSGASLPVYASRESLAVLRRAFGYIFAPDPEGGYRPRLEGVPVDGPFFLFGRRIEPIPLRHGPGSALGFRIGPFAYLTDCSAVPETSVALLQGLEVLVIDALRFRPHASHLSIPQALEVADRLRPARTLLTHLTHEVDHDRDSRQLPAGVELAFDGQRLSFEDAA